MGMGQHLSGVIALKSTTYDKKTDTYQITPEHQKLRDLCNITHPYSIGGGPLIFFNIMKWHNFDMIQSCFIKLNDDEVPDSGDKIYVSVKELEDLNTHLQIVFSGECDDKDEEIDLLNDVFHTDAYSFTDQQYRDAWEALKEFSNDLSKLIKHEKDENTESFDGFYYDADW